MNNWEPIWAKAKLIKHICAPVMGICILAGTEFEVIVNGVDESSPYHNCRGLGVNSVWNDEFVLF